MSSIDAQCLIVHLAMDDRSPAPDVWTHSADGSLSGHFTGSPRAFTWPAPDVAALAGRWRELALPVPEVLVDLVRGHRAFAAMAEHEGLDVPDRIEHDLVANELTAFYDEARVAVVIGDEDDREDVGAAS